MNGQVYRVQVTVVEDMWTVKRRYSEFLQFHQHMTSSNQLPDFVAKLFPKKKVVGSTESDFVEMRRDQLQNYLRGVIMVIIKRPLSPLASSPTMQNLITEVPFLGPEYGDERRLTVSRLSRLSSKVRGNLSDTASLYSVSPVEGEGEGESYVDLPPQSPQHTRMEARMDSPIWKKKEKDPLEDED